MHGNVWKKCVRSIGSGICGTVGNYELFIFGIFYIGQ